MTSLTLALLLTGCAANSRPPSEVPIAEVELIRGDGLDAPLLVAVHGRGGRPESFSAVFSQFDGDLRVACPRASHPFSRGFSWFTVGVRRGDTVALARELSAASNDIALLLNGWIKAHPTSKKPMITGFSQGGMIAFAVAVQHPETLSLAIPLSGWLPPSLWPTRLAPAEAPPIHAIHGEADEVLRLGPTRAGVEALKAKGWDAEISVYPGVGHSLTGPMRSELYRHIRQRSPGAR